MTKREARLLPRLIEALDTLEAPGDIANTVTRIRSILGPACFSRSMLPAADTMVTFTHADHDVASRLRGLGLMLRLAEHRDPVIGAALHRTREALVGNEGVSQPDLMLTLLCLRELIELERERVREPVAPGVQQSVIEAMMSLQRVFYGGLGGSSRGGG